MTEKLIRSMVKEGRGGGGRDREATVSFVKTEGKNSDRWNTFISLHLCIKQVFNTLRPASALRDLTYR